MLPYAAVLSTYKNRGQRKRAPGNFDDQEWERLLGRYAPKYQLPAPTEPCTETRMKIWLQRLNMNETKYKRITGCSLADFRRLNPAWTLREWLGTVLEAI